MSPTFKRLPGTKATFQDDVYFEDLDGQMQRITDVLQIGRDEAGVLDKKLDPELLQLVGRVIDLLDDTDYSDQARQQLAAITHPDLPVAMLRLAFRVRNDRVSELMVERLVELGKSPTHLMAQEAIREATGSQVRHISELADKVFLQVAWTGDLLQIAGEAQRALGIRIRAAQRLIELEWDWRVVPIAIDLFVKWAEDPNYADPLRRLSRTFGCFSQLERQPLTAHVIELLIEALREHENDVKKCYHVLNALASLADATLQFCRDLKPYERDGKWLALALRECAKKTPDATVMMLEWMASNQIEDWFRRQLAYKIKNRRIVLPAPDIADNLIDEALHYVEYNMNWAEAQEEISQILHDLRKRLKGEEVHQTPDEIYEEMLEQLHQAGTVEDELIWKFRHTKGSFGLLQKQRKNMTKEEHGLLLEIVYHERFNGLVTDRIRLLVSAFPVLDDDQRKRALGILFELGNGSPGDSQDRRRVHGFMVEKVDDPKLGELARCYYQRLGVTA